jgi:predicted HTH transcriptional regulator
MERESRFLEYKRQLPDNESIAKTVIAFANGDGGRIIIGIDDKNRSIVGLNSDTIDMLLKRLPVSLSDSIAPPIFPQIFQKNIEDKEVLIVQVFPGNQKPYHIASEGIDKGVYIRVGAHTRRAAGETLEELRLMRTRIGYDEQPMPACKKNELDVSGLPGSMRTEKGLISLEVLTIDNQNGVPHPTRGGVLMFHHEPHKYIPEAYIICSKMRGAKGRDTVESREITGPLPKQLEYAAELLESWLGREPSLSGVKYANRKTAVPMAAVREALANALFHRQYSIPGAIKVALYAERLEVFSPGHFAGPYISEALGDGTSYIRNKVIAFCARRLNLMEKRGTGIRLIIDSMKEMGLHAEFIEGAGWFKVVLNLVATGKDNYVLEPEEALLNLFETKTEITSADLCTMLSVSKATALNVIDSMIHKGRILRVGKGPKTRYRIAGY